MPRVRAFCTFAHPLVTQAGITRILLKRMVWVAGNPGHQLLSAPILITERKNHATFEFKTHHTRRAVPKLSTIRKFDPAFAIQHSPNQGMRGAIDIAVMQRNLRIGRCNKARSRRKLTLLGLGFFKVMPRRLKP